MANGGYINCNWCTYNRTVPGTCDIFGIETSVYILCRAFRKPKQSHTEARKEYPLLNQLLPGIIYSIDNMSVIGANPKPMAKVRLL